MALETEFLNSVGGGKLQLSFWLPEGKPVGIVQLVHGIAEYAGRYGALAAALNEKGYILAAEDHMGHGGSITKAHPMGCIKGGWKALTRDVNALTELLKQRWPGVPLFLMGHSMGSFLARTCLYTYPEAGYAGCILSGTAWQPGMVLKTGLKLAQGEVYRHGEHTASESLKNLMFGAYLKGVKDAKSPNDWISTQREVVDAYDADPLCGFVPSAGLDCAMLEGLQENQKPENLAAMPKDLPVWFFSGDKDPVGNKGKGVKKSVRAFRKAGLRDVELTFYPGARHETLNDFCRDAVLNDLLAWLAKHNG